MSTQLRQGAGDARDVRRILCEHIDEAQQALAGKRITDENVHGARKSLKRARATLRLMRDGVSTSRYQHENQALRDAARPLSAIRDARVLLDTLDRVVKLYGPAAKQSIPPKFRHELAREQAATRRSITHSQDSPHAVRRGLSAARRRVAAWRVNANGWTEIEKGLKRIYKQGRKAMQAARQTPSPDCLHEWRKQTKYLWHQLQILEPLWPGPLGELADQSHKLSDYLGDDHDLAVLREKILAHPKSFEDHGGPGALLALIERCQTQLRAKAFLVGERIYAEKPAVFTARLGRYWLRWQREEPKARAAA